jgi:hypothetical protein
MTDVEKVTNLTSDMVLGYFETMKSCFYVKLGVIAWFEGGDVAKHRELSSIAAEAASAFNDELAVKVLASIRPEVVENLKEDAITALLMSGWAVFEQVIKDLTVPDYATQPHLLQADFHNGILGFTQTERAEIALFYHIRNAIAHYNGAYHAYRTVDVAYGGRHFKSDGHFGEKIDVSIRLAVQIVDDLEKYALKAWSHVGRS